MKPYGYQCISLFSHQNDIVLDIFNIYYIYSRLSVITAFLKPLKPLIATNLVGYRFLITDYEIGCQLLVAGRL
jgi:hypothetical protein